MLDATAILAPITFEPVTCKRPMLLFESRVIRILAAGGSATVPCLDWQGKTDNGNDHVMVMELLGPSLNDWFTLCRRTFSLKTVLLCADPMIHRLEYVHAKGFVHRDFTCSCLRATGRCSGGLAQAGAFVDRLNRFLFWRGREAQTGLP